VGGEIVEANEDIDWESTMINESPYGQGWLAVFKMGDPSGLERLHKPSDPEYQTLVQEEAAKYDK